MRYANPQTIKNEPQLLYDNSHAASATTEMTRRCIPNGTKRRPRTTNDHITTQSA